MSCLIIADFTTHERECVMLDKPCTPDVAPLPTIPDAEYMDGANDVSEPTPLQRRLETIWLPLALVVGAAVGVLTLLGWVS